MAKEVINIPEYRRAGSCAVKNDTEVISPLTSLLSLKQYIERACKRPLRILRQVWGKLQADLESDTQRN